MAKTYRSLPRSLSALNLGQFKESSFKEKEANRRDKLADLGLDLEKLRVDDIRWRVKRRGPVTWTAYTLLFLQNGAVMYLVWYPIHLHRTMPLAYYQLMTALIAATLTESAYVIRQIVQWLFKEISYTREQQAAAREDEA